MSSRPKAFFINGGAGRVICAVPALEKYAEEHPDEKFLIVCEGGTDFFKGHPKLHNRVYDNWHKNLFHDKLVDMELVTPEPYRVWEYFNQQCSLSQAFDIEINNKGVRDLGRPTLKLTQDEITNGKVGVKDVIAKTGKSKTIEHLFMTFHQKKVGRLLQKLMKINQYMPGHPMEFILAQP